MRERIIADTGPLVAFLSVRDKHHEWAVETTRNLDSPFFTNDAVITESCHLLRRTRDGAERLLSLIERGSLQIEFNLSEEVSRVMKLMKRYEDLPMSLADSCIVRMAENIPGSRVFTLDEDFAIYRKLGRQVIPLIAPF